MEAVQGREVLTVGRGRVGSELLLPNLRVQDDASKLDSLLPCFVPVGKRLNLSRQLSSLG